MQTVAASPVAPFYASNYRAHRNRLTIAVAIPRGTHLRTLRALSSISEAAIVHFRSWPAMVLFHFKSPNPSEGPEPHPGSPQPLPPRPAAEDACRDSAGTGRILHILAICVEAPRTGAPTTLSFLSKTEVMRRNFSQLLHSPPEGADNHGAKLFAPMTEVFETGT